MDFAGVAVMVVGAVVSIPLALRGYQPGRLPAGSEPLSVYRSYRQLLGRSILLGLELLVAADIIRTVAVTPTFESVGVLAIIVLIRTFLSFSLELEITGRWPWQKASPQVPLLRSSPAELLSGVERPARLGNDEAAPVGSWPGAALSFPAPVIMDQRWLDAVFLHWRIPRGRRGVPLPAGVVPDIFDGSAWVGLIGFRMRGAGLGHGPASRISGTSTKSMSASIPGSRTAREASFS